MPIMTAAQALVRSLAREGVEVIFGLPGVQIMDVFDVLHGEPGIRLVMVHHEQATTYMADGYARTNGKVGVGAKIGNPARQVVAICGDGGFTYGIPDLATAVQEGANIVTLVFKTALSVLHWPTNGKDMEAECTALPFGTLTSSSWPTPLAPWGSRFPGRKSWAMPSGML